MFKFVSRCWVLLFAALLCSSALAGHALDQAARHDTLAVGVAHPVPHAGARLATPETLEAVLAQDLAQRLQWPLALYQENGKDLSRLRAGRLDLVLIATSDPVPVSLVAIPTGYSVAPLAILRSNTDLKEWQQLKQRKVCIMAGGRHAGTVAAAHGAEEIAFDLLSDALLTLRTGGCEALVHDDIVLEQLLALPEWKKFSARLPAGDRVPLTFIVPAVDQKIAARVRKAVAEWQTSPNTRAALAAMVQQIAFEVYLQQDVPDCH